MKIINNKSFVQKIIIAIVIVLSFNFVAPTFSQAAKDDNGSVLGEIGGTLFGPFIDLFAGICDSVMVILQVCMSGSENIGFSTSGWLVSAKGFKASDYGMDGGSSTTVSVDKGDLDEAWWGFDTYNIPVIKYSPEQIFGNQIPGLDANFINPKKWNDSEKESKSIAVQLQTTISQWYNTLRNLVLVLLLSVLLYVGIRMMLTSIASDKAKYKQMLMDWLVAVCLLFFLHYIMSFTMTFVDIIAEGLFRETSVTVSVPQDSNVTFTTTLTGYCRFLVQYKDLGTRLIYLIFYIGLTVCTCIFTWKYIKRAITLAFLTLMAPLVTLTYPIDKIGDGKAQAFNMWLKEYIFNALLQPFHLILYTIFLGESMEIAIDNPLYAILFLAFISPAEKMLRKFFKFDQASSAGAGFAGGFGGAAAFNMVKGLMNRGAKGLSSGKGGSSSGGNGNIRQQQQLTDPHAPDGSLDSFVGNRGNNKEGQRPTEGQRIKGELDNINDMRNNPEYQNDEWKKYLDEEERNIKESDQRGVFEWGKDAWNDSQLKQNLLNSKPAQFTRKIGNKGINSIRSLANNVNKGVKKIPKPLRNSARGAIRVAKDHVLPLAGRAAGAAAMGAIGLGMGIAGADLEDVLTMGAAGAALGWNTGPAVVHNIGSGISSAGNDIRSSFEAGAYGDEEAALREQDRRFVANQDNRDYFAEQMTKNTGHEPTTSELNQTMKVAAEYNRAGITNVKQINKSMLLEKELESEIRKSPTSMSEKEITRSARDQAMTIAHIANSVDAKDLRDPKKVEQLQKSFARELMSKDKSMNSNAAEAQASRIMGMVMKQKKVY